MKNVTACQSTPPLSGMLMVAAADGDVAAVRNLLAQGAKADTRSGNDATPLMMAAYAWRMKGDFSEGVQLLLDADASLELKDKDGQTALMFAAIYGLEKMAAMLIDKGADFEATNNRGMTPRDLALHNDHPEVVGLLDALAEKRQRAIVEESGAADKSKHKTVAEKQRGLKELAQRQKFKVSAPKL